MNGICSARVQLEACCLHVDGVVQLALVGQIAIQNVVHLALLVVACTPTHAVPQLPMHRLLGCRVSKAILVQLAGQ